MGVRTWWPKASAGQLQRLLGIDCDLPWVEYTVCREVDPTVFFPEKGESAIPALRVCGRCPVRDECADDALATGDVWGVRGGLTEQQRRRIREGKEVA
jgi:WhiB family redox-sensing transcriptional regulator